MGKNGELRAEPDREPRTQAAALPWRRTAEGALEVLLITSRETQRWVIPKGWPVKGLGLPRSAGREALEEAGVIGEVGKKKLGVYLYEKRLRSGRLQQVRVSVYPLKVEGVKADWPEAAERRRRWTAPAEAAALVEEPELADLIRNFAPR